MTPALLREAGQLLYGDRWQSALADALGVRRDTVRRWGTRENIPAGAWSDINALLNKRVCDMAEFMASDEYVKRIG
jgi:hypothetical protein